MADRPRELMQLYLCEFGVKEVFGIYGANEDALAARMRFLHPAAARSFLKMNEEKVVRCTDMLRTPEGSLVAVQQGKAALRPGWSGHNYGFSIDIDVDWMIKTHRFKDKVTLDLWMATHGWYCHNILGSTISSESWHYNYFGEEAEHFISYRKDTSKVTWSYPVAYKIVEYYGHWWVNADAVTVQAALQRLGLYRGDLDGVLGTLSGEAIKAFQRAWLLDVDGIAGPRTKRTLMLVSAERMLTRTSC